MRVLVLSTNSDEAGAPIHVYTLISLMRSEVDFLIVFGEDGPIAQRLRDKGVTVRVVPEMRSRISPIQDAAAFRAISAHIAGFRPHVIHAHSSKAGMLGRLLALRHRLPCIYTVHGWGWRGLGVASGSLVFLLEKLLSIIPRCRYIYVSRSVEREARGQLRVAEHKGKVIYNGVDDIGDATGAVAGPLRIVMPARISSAKDHESLIMAFERLRFEAELLLCGTGTDEVAFLDRVRDWAPTRHHAIKCLGRRSDIPSLLKSANVFALISNFEALPLSIIEAMSAGRAIIASDVGGVSELIEDGSNGLLVRKNDVEAIAASLTRLQDSDLRARLGRAARKRYENDFTSTQMVESVIQAYREACEFF